MLRRTRSTARPWVRAATAARALGSRLLRPASGRDAAQLRLAEIWSSSPVGIVELDLDQVITDCNVAFAAMVGQGQGGVVGRHGWEFFHPDSPPPDVDAVGALVGGERDRYSAERLLRASDGAPLAVKLDWSVLRDPGGAAHSLVCFVTDVSVQAAAVAAVDAARTRAEVLWERAPVGVIEGTAAGVITSANDALLTMLGRRREDLVGTPAAALADPSYTPSINRGVAQLLAGHTYDAERRYLHADGRSVPVHVSTAFLRDERDEVSRLVGFVVDMTQAEANRAELERRRAFVDTLLETVDVGIVTCDATGGGVRRNRAQRLMLGLPADSEADAGPDFEVRGADDVVLAPSDYPLARTLRGETVHDLDLSQGPSGGPWRDILVRGQQLRAPDGAVIGAVIAVTDVTAARQSTRALAEQGRRLAEAKRIGRLGSFGYDLGTGTYTASAQLRALWGLPAEGEVEELARRAMHPDDAARVSSEFAAALAQGGRHSWRFRLYRLGDGALRHFSTVVEVTLDESGSPVKVTGTQQDVTDLVEAEQRAVRASSQFEAILAATPDYTFITELATGAVLYGSPGKEILGLDSDRLRDLGPQLVATLVHPDDQQQLRAIHATSATLEDREVLQLRFRARHTDGTWRWLSRRVTPFRRDEESGEVLEVLGVMRDVTDVVQVEEKLTRAALHDPLTGLPNRALLMDRLETAVARAGSTGRALAVLFCDLDGFKAINDAAGHAAGDAVLRVAADRMRNTVREHDLLARVGGDEFVVVVEPWHRDVDGDGDGDGDGGPQDPTGTDDRELALTLAERICAALVAPVLVAGVEHRLSASIGVSWTAVGDGRPVDPDHLLREADAAMYRAKRRGRNRVEVHEVDRSAS